MERVHKGLIALEGNHTSTGPSQNEHTDKDADKDKSGDEDVIIELD